MTSAKPFSISQWSVYQAWLSVKANKGSAGIDGQTTEEFEKELKKHLYKLWNRMSSGSYFPPNVKRVDIPKDAGVRTLGITTVSDRVAQTVVKQELEPALEAIFDEDSYGYRPQKGCHDALAITRKRCWRQNWVIDLDIKGFFDNLNWDLLRKALHKHTNNPWVLLYIERWLKAPMESKDGEITERTKGVPQGSVVGPLLANLFLHYAFDAWMRRNYSHIQFARYADDIVVHCDSEEEAKALRQAIEQRMRECFLECHPEKTKVVYCFDADRPGDYPVKSFDFLGFCFRPRLVRNRRGKFFVSFTPAISPKKKQKIRDALKSLELHKQTHRSLAELAHLLNQTVRGWIQYYGLFHKTEVMLVLAGINQKLLKWARKKYKRLKGSTRRAGKWLKGVSKTLPDVFVHWEHGYRP